MLSLRQRALLAGIATGAISVGIGTLGVLSYINSRVSDRFDAALVDRHTELVVGLSITTENPEALRDLVFDPAYGTPYSGRYWQVSNDQGELFTSASLFDETLKEPKGEPNTPTLWNTTGPDNEAVRVAYQRITFEDGSIWGVSVAEGQSQLVAERQAAQTYLLPLFGLVGLTGVAGSLLLMSVIQGPLRKLQTDVAGRWDKDEDLNPSDYPGEVAPLVSDLNQLLRRNQVIVSGSRKQAADLAHALKTPSSILRNELSELTDSGANTDIAREALDRIDAQLNRALARLRAMNTAELSHSRTDLSSSIERLARLFTLTAEREQKTLAVSCDPGMWVRMDAQDIEEVLGNLLDNAVKWCSESVHVSAKRKGQDIEIRIEDDGPGLPEEARREALRPGGRLDTSVAGSGLGLSIAVELLNAYDARLELGVSDTLAGLEVRVTIPMRANQA